MSTLKINQEEKILYNTPELNYGRTEKQINILGLKTPEVLIVDGIMGCGKTSAMINYINNAPDNVRFLYITPYLSEVERIKKECKSKNFKDPTTKNKNGSKVTSLETLLTLRENIVSTHALFNKLGENELRLFLGKDYILILDEVADVISQQEITESDRQIIFEESKLAHMEGCQVVWDDKQYSGTLDTYKKMAEIGNLYYLPQTPIPSVDKKTQKPKKVVFFTWSFPINIFKYFIKNFVVTYMFDGQIQCAYYKMHDINYNYVHVKNLKPKNKYNPKYYVFEDQLFTEPQDNDCSIYKELINICDSSKMNTIGSDIAALSKNWYSKNVKGTRKDNEIITKQLIKNMQNFFKNITKTSLSDNMWTTFKSFKSNLSGQGYTKGFVSCSARATNEFRNKKALAYMINRYLNPNIKKFFGLFDVSLNEDKYALSEMLQWIFRSQIRTGKPINIYIPSARMRNLLIGWLNNEYNGLADNTEEIYNPELEEIEDNTEDFLDED